MRLLRLLICGCRCVGQLIDFHAVLRTVNVVATHSELHIVVTRVLEANRIDRVLEAEPMDAFICGLCLRLLGHWMLHRQLRWGPTSVVVVYIGALCSCHLTM